MKPRLAALLAALFLLAACTQEDRPRTSPTNSSPSPASSSFSPVPQSLTWRSCAQGPSSRQEVAAAALDEKIIVAGGLVGSGTNSSIVESYDPATDKWTPLPPLPVKLDHAMATAWRGMFVVLGGNAEVPSSRVFVLKGGKWEMLPPLKRPRVAGAAVTVGDEIIVVGGVGPVGHVATVERFNGTAWRDGAAIPSLRDHLGAATDGRLVYAVGGRREGGHFATHEAYDVQADKWQTLPEMPTARSGLGAAALGQLIVAAGGEGPRIFPEVEAFHPARAWSRLPDLGIPRHGVGVVAVGSRVYALLGGTQVGLGSSRACEVLDLS